MSRQFGNYDLTDWIGAGGMGEVWRGEHRLLKRPAAIKVIQPEATGSYGDGRPHHLLQRFEREAQATSALRSPHTIQLYDFGITDEGVFYYVMELLEGCTVQTLVERAGPVAPSRAVWLLRQACESLAEAHHQGLVHRDIKPGNLFVCQLGLKCDFVKVLDFGLVKLSGAVGENASQLTDDNVAQGSPAFMPPEVVHGSSTFDQRSDLYSLGCVAYWLLSGQLVFEADSPFEAVLAHIKDPPPPLSAQTELRIPAELEAIVMSCLEKDPARRPQTAGELSRRLAECGADDWSDERAATWWQRHRPEIWEGEARGKPSRSSQAVGATPGGGPVAGGDRSFDKPTIVVLPFANRSSDPEQEYFADGITEDIITDLSRFRELFVIARNSAFAYKGADASATDVARELGVRYVVEGSVRRMGNRVRITVELIDGRTAANLWAERYDREMTNLFDVEAEVGQKIVAALAGRVEAESLARAKQKTAGNLDAYDCLLRGKEYYHRNTWADSDQALEWFERAINIDPDYAVPYAWWACTFGRSRHWVSPDDQGEMMRRAEAYMERARQLDDDESDCHRLLSELARMRRRFDKALFHQERAISLNPNDARIVCQRGETFLCLGRADEAVHWLQKAMRLNPHHPDRWFGHLGRALHLARRYDDALKSFHRKPTRSLVEHAFMAACCVELGDAQGAEQQVAAVHRIDPDFRATSFAESLGYKDWETHLEPLVSALTAAGLPG